MTDKSFGDHTNRNVVKNPLLSTAVTGLSIEDLTHNAMLLPVSLSQEAITRSEQQPRPQVRALENTDDAAATYPAGDANPNLHPPKPTAVYPPQPPTTTPNPPDRQNTQKKHENPKPTVSKASLKSEDDFDVNEYFARLHGTRYVSAPFNSALKEDQNANLEGTEENLEEINLNEPDKVEFQQSITADIAQNFSQLPTMLPQVASAVFSSFSNMLQTRKSREPSQEVTSGYQDIQFERSEPRESREVLPPPPDPPKEPLGVPPTFGTSNYRLPPKKKYAQIPGLTSGDSQNQQPQLQPFNQNIPLNQNVPQYFVPSSITEPSIQNVGQNPHANLAQTITNQSNKLTYFTPEVDAPIKETIPQPAEDLKAQNIPDMQRTPTGHVVDVQSQASQDTSQSVLPPPPMFANQPKRDNQTGKSVLPPSVARLIGANHPIIKQQTSQVPSFTENIFIPSPVDTQSLPSDENLSYGPNTSIQVSSASIPSLQSHMPPFTPSMPVRFGNSPQTSIPLIPASTDEPWPSRQEEKSHLPPPPPNIPINRLTLSNMTQTAVAPPSLSASSIPTSVPAVPPSNRPTLSMSSSKAGFPQSIALNPPSSVSPVGSEASVSSSASAQIFPPSNFQTASFAPQIFTPSASDFGLPNIQTSVGTSQGSLPQPPTFFNPNAATAETKEFPPIGNQATPTPEPPKSVPEPPKASGNINYRMTKKRPQYYAGPIEGVGAISNNIKPVIAPVNAGSFQGALLTPQQADTSLDQAAQNVEQYSQTPFDISRPAEPLYSSVAATPQQDYNTAFDMSRPTTESYSEPKQESSGFGILGSLKSKLGSLDINKIQNTVTTFFDPAYNDAKKESGNVQEHVTYGHQQYVQYTQPNNFEIFVPNVDHPAPGYDYNYQISYQSQYDYDQTSQPPSKIAQNYYPIQSVQNVGNYFSDADMNRYQDSVTNTASSQAIENEEYQNTPKSQEEINASSQPDIEIQQSHSARPLYQVSVASKSPEMQQTLSSGTPLATHSKTHVKPHEVSDAGNFFDTQSTNIAQSVSFNQPNINAPVGFEAFSKGADNDQQSQSETNVDSKTEVKQSINYQEPPFDQVESSGSNVALGQMSSVESAYSFFDNPISQVIGSKLIEPSDRKAVTTQPNFEIDSSFGAAASFFDNASTDKTQINQKLEVSNTIFKTLPQPIMKEKDQKYDEKPDNDVQNIMSDLRTNPTDFFSSLNPADTKIQSIFSSAFDFKKSEVPEQQKSEVITNWPDETRPLDMSSAPLFGLSAMLADKTKELHDLEDEMRTISIQQTTEEASYFESPKTEFDNKETVSELNICETCREVNKPEDYVRDETEDLTTQLIENITSPIQLSNPVEVPLTESNTPADDREDFDTIQCEEISHITEETIEAIQVQAATELLDDDMKTRDYGWSTEEVTQTEKVERDYTFEEPTGLEQPNYSLPVNPNVIGFFEGNSLFEEVPDKMKSDFEKQDNVSRVLRQISVPSAPPAEDDSKSESLDVRSIEQDASKDFPIFEEYVIEPDDGNTDKDVESPKLDTFSSRVDKYKKHEDHSTFLTSTSPSIPIPSYFDTGNYAAETHYRNSISSPTSTFTLASIHPVTAPPGFEEKFQTKLSSDEPFPDFIDPVIPETSTQTRGIYSATFTTANVTNVCTTTTSTMPNVSNVVIGNALPTFQNVFRSVKEAKQEETLAESLSNQMNLMLGLQTLTTEENDPVLQQEVKAESKVAAQQEVMPGASIFKTPEFDLEPQRLPDPMNFFSSTDTASDAQDQSFNRLASYFSAPAKSDHTKPFFELSQSENHYRQKQPQSTQNTASNIQNIPHEQYAANINLMRDLTSVQPDLKPEQIVRTVNYFTIEYDNDTLINNLVAQKESNNKKVTIDKNINDIYETTDKKENEKNETKDNKINDKNENIDIEHEVNDETLLTTLNTCQHCCNLTVGYVELIKYHDVLKDFKVKKCMDGNNQPNDNKMETPGNRLERNASVTVDFENIVIHEDSDQGVSVSTETRSSTEYSPVRHHWFYRVDVDSKSTWRGFSAADSKALEDAYQSPDLNENTVVATDGGRYDVNVKGRLRVAVYWSDKPTLVRRCSWFYKGTTDARYVPYTETVAEKLEEEYRHGMTTGEWHRRLVLPNNEMVVMHGPAVMVHFLQSQSSDAFSSPPLFAFGKRVYRNPPKIRVSRDQTDKIDHLIMLVHGAGEYRHQKEKEKIQSTMRPRVVRRGHDESEIEEMEPTNIDHLLLLCHGVGSACDMRFRNVEEVVDDFRATSLQLLQSHYKTAYDSGRIGRVEVLPISWHATLHSGETGVDKRLSRITLDSIPRLRSFTNDTVLDVLFYTSPVFCQTIIDTVCAELNRIYKLFRVRNPNFTGDVSLGGHSLGSVILYDLLCHQQARGAGSSSELRDKRYVSGAAGTGQVTVKYPTLDFSPIALYALGSPIAIFECIRGVDSLGEDFALPTCKNFFNIFHPYDPIAYRIEPLINPTLRDYKPHLIPHHKGRKRMHLELKDTMARVGADIKQKLIESIKSTWSSMWKTSSTTQHQLERVVEEELEKEQISPDMSKEDQVNDEELKLTPEMLGKLNNGRRIDYVLQEAPFEMINEYLFAMSSHVCYWESEDTMLLMLREIYDALGVRPDNTVPQNTLTVTTTRPPRADTPTEETVFLHTTDYPSTSKDEPGL